MTSEDGVEQAFDYKPLNVKLRYGTNPHQWYSLFIPTEWNFHLEELKSGKGLREALHEGFQRAWTSIRDSNISSMITAVILYWMGGTAIIQGFALVFGLGVLVSMITAISVSRSLLYALPLNDKSSSTTMRFLLGNGLSR